jgi:hypothetical protein
VKNNKKAMEMKKSVADKHDKAERAWTEAELIEQHAFFAAINRRLDAGKTENPEAAGWLEQRDPRFLSHLDELFADDKGAELFFDPYKREIDMMIEDERTCLWALRGVAKVVDAEHVQAHELLNRFIKLLEDQGPGLRQNVCASEGKSNVSVQDGLQLMVLGHIYTDCGIALSECAQYMIDHYLHEDDEDGDQEDLAMLDETIAKTNTFLSSAKEAVVENL